MFWQPAMSSPIHEDTTPRRHAEPSSYYAVAQRGLDEGDEGWSYAAKVEIVPPVSGGGGEAGFKAFLASVTSCSRNRPSRAARVPCSCCGHKTPAVLTVFQTNWGGGGPQVEYRQLLAVCDHCRNVSVIAEAAKLHGAWRAVKVGFTPSRACGCTG